MKLFGFQISRVFKPTWDPTQLQFNDGPVVPVGLCSACRARDAHIEDLRRLLDSEKAERSTMTFHVLGVNRLETNQGRDVDSPGIVGPDLRSAAQRRRDAMLVEEEKSGLTQDEAKREFWAKRKAHYDAELKALNEQIAEQALRRKERHARRTETESTSPGELVPVDNLADAVEAVADAQERAEARTELNDATDVSRS